MTVLLPLVEEKTKDRMKVVPQSEEDGLLARFKDKDLSTFMVLQNKKPIWNEGARGEGRRPVTRLAHSEFHLQQKPLPTCWTSADA
jgi:hypothetical protein